MTDVNLYAEGCIYYYDNRTNSKKDYENPDLNHDFLVSRPVYILGSGETPFDVYTVTVCAITSSANREGIPISIDGCRQGKILPYSIHSLHPEYLTRFMGHVNPDVIAKVRQAVEYHLGLSKEIPQYIQNCIDEVEEKERFIKSLSTKEKTVYNFMTKHCVVKETYYALPEELANEYLSIYSMHGYTRVCDFTKAFDKIQKNLYPKRKIASDCRRCA